MQRRVDILTIGPSNIDRSELRSAPVKVLFRMLGKLLGLRLCKYAVMVGGSPSIFRQVVSNSVPGKREQN